ncbi:protein YnhH [Enterobacter kobei]|uniref:protein YnhH n=1 Tax=Enterobacter kobei TaxID=208224 RepID=UPI003F64B96F
MNCNIQLSQRLIPPWADTQAHIPLHAFFDVTYSYDVTSQNFRNTGLTPRRCAPGALFPYPSQLKD